MANSAGNPLFKHFRQPAIYIRLPSGGKFYPDGCLNLPITGEIPIYPMTAKDELTLKTPDALMNGSGVTDVIKSCCPNIQDPWLIPSVDVDALFIAIRLASYGPGMEIQTNCPHCKEKNEHNIDLRVVLDNVKHIDYSAPMVIDGLSFQFKPQQYRNINQMNIMTFEERRLIDTIIQNEELEQTEKLKLFNTSFNKLKDMNIGVVINNILSITTEEGIVVTDLGQITEFLDNTSRLVFDSIKEHATKLNSQSKLDDLNLTCAECHKEYTSGLEFDQSNFFE